MTEPLSTYTYRGARALVLLHEHHLRQCLDVWKQAKATNLQLPKSENENYQSLETLLEHILGAAGHYMIEICEYLGLPDPAIREAPNVDAIEAEADQYLEHVLEHWRLPLVHISEETLDLTPKTDVSNRMPYYAMLEHAVMHPIRHEFQLRELMQHSLTSVST
jgi:uncharacterized damage-inducible protein DinB